MHIFRCADAIYHIHLCMLREQKWQKITHNSNTQGGRVRQCWCLPLTIMSPGNGHSHSQEGEYYIITNYKLYTSKERSLRLVTFETFDQSDEKTWPDQQKTTRKTKTMMMTNAFREQPQRGIFEYFREHPQMAIPEKFWVWPLIHCYEFRPFQTNLRGVDQISQFQPNLTIL